MLVCQVLRLLFSGGLKINAQMAVTMCQGPFQLATKKSILTSTPHEPARLVVDSPPRHLDGFGQAEQ